jgi:hypothetical protein
MTGERKRGRASAQDVAAEARREQEREEQARLAQDSSVPHSLLHSPEAVELYREVLRSLPADWIKAEQQPLFEAWCAAVVRARKLQVTLDGASMRRLDRVEQLAKLYGAEQARVLALARSLRLTNQSRIRPDTAGRRTRGPSTPAVTWPTAKPAWAKAPAEGDDDA